MPSLPIPLVSSLVLGFLLIQLSMSDRRQTPVIALLAICALQGAIIAGVQHYGFEALRPAQAILACCIAPIAWVAFQVTAVRGVAVWDIAHLVWPVLAIALLATRPILLDVMIPGVFAGYGFAILWVSLKGPDALPRLRLVEDALPGLIWTIIGASLIGSALSDVLIVAVAIAGVPHWQPWIISLYSSAMLLIIGGLSLSGALDTGRDRDETEPNAPTPPDISEQDADIVVRLDALMTSERLYLDPDLTLTRLARRLVLPVKQVSAAVNKVTGENVSRYINGARVAAAQKALTEGESVTAAMLGAGFNTKSNFNREFLRVAGVPPSDWVRQHSAEIDV